MSIRRDQLSVLCAGVPARCVLLGVLLALTGCVDAGSGPRSVSLAELVAEHDAYDGHGVIVEGVVHTYPSPRHYWIEDAEVNRVELVPPGAAAAHVGDRVRAEGRFTFRDDEGRRLEVEDLEVLDDEQVSAPGRTLLLLR